MSNTEQRAELSTAEDSSVVEALAVIFREYSLAVMSPAGANVADFVQRAIASLEAEPKAQAQTSPPLDAQAGAPKNPTPEQARAALEWLYWHKRSDAYTEYTAVCNFIEQHAAQPKAQAQAVDPTDPGYDVEVLREHVRHLERRVRQLSAPSQAQAGGVRLVTLRSASMAINHVSLHNGPGRLAEATGMLEEVTPSPEARETAEPAFATDRSFGWCPDQCPITRLPFFMWIQHPRDGWVPTYGGPLDSYTIPVMGGLPTEPFHERPLERERFDHDAGYWVDGVEEIPLRVAHDDALAAPVSQAEPSTPRGAPAGWSIESGKGWASIRNNDSQCGQDFYPDRDPLIYAFLRAIDAARASHEEKGQG